MIAAALQERLRKKRSSGFAKSPVSIICLRLDFVLQILDFRRKSAKQNKSGLLLRSTLIHKIEIENLLVLLLLLPTDNRMKRPMIVIRAQDKSYGGNEYRRKDRNLYIIQK